MIGAAIYGLTCLAIIIVGIVAALRSLERIERGEGCAARRSSRRDAAHPSPWDDPDLEMRRIEPGERIEWAGIGHGFDGHSRKVPPLVEFTGSTNQYEWPLPDVFDWESFEQERGR